MGGNKNTMRFPRFSAGKTFLFIILLSVITVKGDTNFFKGDMAVFDYSEETYLLEIYLAAYRNQLDYQKIDDTYKGNFGYIIQIWNGNILSVRDTINTLDTYSEDKKPVAGQQLLNWARYILPPGEYKVEVMFFLERNKIVDMIKQELILEKKNFQKFRISEIQFASSIKKSDENKPFYKNGYQIVPNPNRIYGESFPELFFYFEIYSPERKDVKVGMRYSIMDEFFQEIKALGSKEIEIYQGIGADVYGTGVAGLKNGMYYLKISMADNDSVYRAASFSVYKNSSQNTIFDGYEKSIKIHLPLDEYKLDNEFSLTAYLHHNKDKKMYNKLDITGKYQYLTDLWIEVLTEKHDPDYRIEYLARIESANNRFREGLKEGWKTNRGRIYVLYGEPDEIDRTNSRSNTKPFQIWSYYFRNKKEEFIFVDMNGNGDYYLVHSTLTGEIHDYEWEKYIYQN